MAGVLSCLTLQGMEVQNQSSAEQSSPLWQRGLQAIGATGVRALAGLAVQKMMAMWYGPVGITLLNHLQNMTSLIISIPNDGVNRGLSALLPATEDEAERWQIKKAALLINIGVLVVALLIMLAWPAGTVLVFSRMSHWSTWLAIFIPSLFGYLAFSYWCGLQLAAGRVKLYSYVQALTAVVALVVAAYGIFQGRVEWGLMGFVIGQGLGGVIAWLHTLRTPKLMLPKSTNIRPYLRQVGSFALMAVGVMVFGRVSDFLIRTYAMGRFHELDLGYWQAVARLSEAYTLPINTFLTAVVFPGLAALAGQRAPIGSTLKRSMVLALPVCWAGLLLCYFIGADLLVWLNDIEFRAAAPLLPYQLLGDAFRFPAFFFATVVLSRQQPMRYLTIEGISLLVYLVALYFLLPKYDITGFVMAHAVRSMVYLPVTIWAAWRR